MKSEEQIRQRIEELEQVYDKLLHSKDRVNAQVIRADLKSTSHEIELLQWVLE